MNKLGINCYNCWNMKYADYLKMLKDIGYDAIFTGHFTSCENDDRSTSKIAEAADRIGLLYESIHAPFDGINNMWNADESGDVMLKRLTDCVEDCARYGIPITVVHLSSGDNAPHVNDIGKARFDALVECAVKNNVTVAFENQRKLANLAFVFELYKDVKQVGFCWDVGHEKCFADGIEFMPLFGNRLVYTHIHDNYAVHNGDLHMIPFDGSIDYGRTAYLLAKYGKGVSFTLEIFPEYEKERHGKYEGLSAEKFYEKAYNAAIKLRDMTHSITI